MDEVSILSAQVEALRRKIDYFNASNMYVQNIICDIVEESMHIQTAL